MDDLLDRAAAEEAQHEDAPRLADAVRTVRRLQVRLRVPVRVVEDDGVGRGERQAEPPRARRQKEDERTVLVGGIRAGVHAALESAHRLPALLGPGGAVQSLVGPAAQREVVL